MTIDKKRTVSITGCDRRQQKIAGIPANIMYEISLYDHIVRLHLQRGFNTFLCGLYDGFDLLAAKAVLSAQKYYPDIKLVAVIPFADQEVNYSEEDRTLYEDILSNVSHYIFTSQTYDPGAFTRNCHFLSDNCASVLCFHSGEPCNTTRIAWRAMRRGADVTNLYCQ